MFFSILAAFLMSNNEASANSVQEPDQQGPKTRRAQAEAVSDIITVIGKRGVVEVPGSVTRIDAEDLSKQSYSDVNRVLRAVPGVNLQEEDGFGLRPNIGLRGSGSDRSSKVLIMEDGVPMAPAPFAAPSAYYFPNVARMSRVEVTKNAGAAKYGPITTAGTIQFLSTPIPDAAQGRLDMTASDLGQTFAYVNWGNRYRTSLPFEVGLLMETIQQRADGFKKIDRGSTGFERQDYVVKLGFYAKPAAPIAQSLVLKIQHSDEIADETYLGLTQGDFDATPLMRYRASQKDQMRANHDVWQALYRRALGAGDLNLIAYRTEFARNWEKLDRFDNSQLSGLAACASLNAILSDPLTCGQEYQVLRGPDGYVSPDDVLGIRQNNRRYYAQGVQAVFHHRFEFAGVSHRVSLSTRLHEDAVDRFQEQDQFRIENGFLVRTTDNPPGSQSNRLSKAEAFSAYAEDKIDWGRWSLTAGVRYSDIKTNQRRWNSPDRTVVPDSVRDNDFHVLVPLVGAVYEIDDRFSLLASFSQGFAPPGPSTRASDGTKPEQSDVYEFGGRFIDGDHMLELIGFYTDYGNLLAECTNSSGGSECVIGDTQNAGAARASGVELSARSKKQWANGLVMPMSLVYSYTETELLSSVDSDIFGMVHVGDEIPYVPTHQLSVQAGLEGARWGLDVSANYVSDARDVPGQGEILPTEKIPARTLVDATLYFDVSDQVRLKIKGENILNETYLAARRPYGLRPGKPREVFVGVSFEF